MKYDIVGKIKVENHQTVYPGRADNAKGTILFTDTPMFNLKIGTVCPKCGQGIIVREIDKAHFKDFVCIHCGEDQAVYEDCNGIF